MLVLVNIQTSHLLSPTSDSTRGYECFALKHCELKTFYFFGFHYREYSCILNTRIMPSVGPNETRFYWPSAKTTQAWLLDHWIWDISDLVLANNDHFYLFNYQIQRVKVTVQDDLTTNKIENTIFLKPSYFSALSWTTGSRKRRCFLGF